MYAEVMVLSLRSGAIFQIFTEMGKTYVESAKSFDMAFPPSPHKYREGGDIVGIWTPMKSNYPPCGYILKSNPYLFPKPWGVATKGFDYIYVTYII